MRALCIRLEGGVFVSVLPGFFAGWVTCWMREVGRIEQSQEGKRGVWTHRREWWRDGFSSSWVGWKCATGQIETVDGGRWIWFKVARRDVRWLGRTHPVLELPSF
jgi:hypothetical protein